jgi:BlaI family transcriptional regulator, penicillinase repressor
MAPDIITGRGHGPRKSLLELAPLELDCMNALWPMGEGSVREIRERLALRRPRAYTTIMTIMDRLARKGVVERRKVGRAYLYRANLSAEDARTHALGQVVENFFGGKAEVAVAELRTGSSSSSAVMVSKPEPLRAASRQESKPVPAPIAEQAPDPSPEPAVLPARLDATLL